MNLFAIHSGSDREVVEGYLSELKRKTYSLKALLLKNGNQFWKIDADQKIKKAQMVVFFVGKNSHESPYIAWELKRAMKYHKPIYTVKLAEDNLSHPATLLYDKFSKEEIPYDKEVSFSELFSVINNYEKSNYDIFNGDLESMDKSVLLEQYKMFLQTSEDLVSRRQNVNSFYISINSALVAMFSTMFALELKAEYRVMIGIIFAFVGIVLATSWIKTLSAYGNLNGSKMKIISGIEKQLPASLYDAEWAALSDRLNKKKYVSFTDSEKIIPKIFIGIYVCIFILLVVSLLLKFYM